MCRSPLRLTSTRSPFLWPSPLLPLPTLMPLLPTLMPLWLLLPWPTPPPLWLMLLTLLPLWLMLLTLLPLPTTTPKSRQDKPNKRTYATNVQLDFIQRRNRTEHAVQQVTETRIS